MSGRRTSVALLGAAAVAAAPGLVLAAGSTAKGKTRKVTVNDNYYGPHKLTVHVGDTIDWVWAPDESDVHDVKLASGPKGARKFQSDALAAGDHFKRRLTRAGTYKIICTFHEEEMSMTITVKRAPRR